MLRIKLAVFRFAAGSKLVKAAAVSLFLSCLVSRAVTPAIAQSPSKSKDCPGDTVDRLGPEIAMRSRAFLAELKTAVQSGDSRKVVDMIHYPIQVNTPTRHYKIQSRRAFLDQYSHIITAQIKETITDKESSRCLFANYQGFMIGDGQIWFKEFSPGRFRIFTINLETELTSNPIPQSARLATDVPRDWSSTSRNCAVTPCVVIEEPLPQPGTIVVFN